jgi:hypothetical protein
VADSDGDPLPSFVERDFRKYLECGLLAYGFARPGAPAAGMIC